MSRNTGRYLRDPILDASYSQTSPLLLSNHTVNLLTSEEITAGWRRDGHMSSVRRFFCLYCTFDLFFTFLVWLTCVMVTGSSIWDMWKNEVLGYNIHSSLVDVVYLAITRFLILLIFYGACHLNHWFIVAFTTTSSCVFLIAKVFLFEWTKTSQPVFEVSFILISFSLCWSEAWFLDCKVLTSEFQAREILSSISQEQPFIRGNRIGIPSDLNSFTDYYSPRDSPDGSPISSRKLQLTLQDEEYRQKASETIDDTLKLLKSSDWKEIKKDTHKCAIIKEKYTEKFGKVFLLTGVVECPADFLYHELSANAENIPKWYPNILEFKFIKKIDDETALSYQVTSDFASGAIASRDFINVQRSVKRDGYYICCGVSVEYDGNISTKYKCTRGYNKITCWIIKPILKKSLTDLDRCQFQWLNACDLKGWMPGYIVDNAIPSAMIDFLYYIQTHMDGNRRQASI